MKVKTLIEKLEKMDPEAEVRLHDKSGEPVLFVLCAKKYPDVWLQTEGDVYMEMLETGIDVPMVRKHLGDEAADHMQDFCEEHGLI